MKISEVTRNSGFDMRDAIVRNGALDGTERERGKQRGRERESCKTCGFENEEAYKAFNRCGPVWLADT